MQNTLKKIAIYGAGAFGREVKMLLDQINSVNPVYEFIGFFDDGMPKGDAVGHYPILGGISELNNIDEKVGLVFAIGNPKTKKKLIENLTNKKIWFPILIHPEVYLHPNEVSIGEGAIICAGCILTVNIKIGCHVILNLACTIGHDVLIDDYSALMPRVNIAGEVIVKKKVYVGAGAVVINRLEIGESAVIGAGAVVIKSIPSDCTAVGVPARIIQKMQVLTD